MPPAASPPQYWSRWPTTAAGPQAQDVAAQLRGRGIATEVAAKAEKFGKQIKYADKRGIPFVWFTAEDGTHQVKDIRTGEQLPADPKTWAPPAEDLHAAITPGPATAS